MSEQEPNRLGEDRVEKGMRLAYGLASVQAGESVLEAIERQTGASVRVHLPDECVDEAPILRIPPEAEQDAARGDSRYQIVGEIARGGVGVVFKGHDRDLGRDVAIKILRPDLKGSPEIIQRFIEEAQIEGQLQHPGVVPIYGLGVQPDGRPYFAMKLIKGDTLASLLKARRDAGADRRRLLNVFEKVCETIAYAHARHVIHRDLKPANILVGAFGQVQVVDWGFAKVLARGGNADEEREPSAEPERSVIHTVRSESQGSASVVGSVMGTPAYMPPEQALGHVARVDETSDVFSLGAILLEILTGGPPYAGRTQAEVLGHAARCEMAEALGRLAASGADAALASLATACLAPAQAARPRNASEVAAAVSAYLASLEERARKAEVEAETSRLKAVGERRVRRLTVALAAVVVTAVLGGGAAWWRAQRTEQERAARATDTTMAALEEAGLLLGSARKADVLDLAPWPGAVAAAERAVALAASVRAPDEVRLRAENLLAQARGETDAARERAERERTERERVRRLRRVRELQVILRPKADPEGEFAAAFEACGLSLERPEEAAARFAEGSEAGRGEILRALEDWREVRVARALDVAPVERLLGLLDPDGVRAGIRVAGRAMDVKALQGVLAAVDTADAPPATLRLLARALLAAGDVVSALDVSRRWRERSPGDPDACVLLGIALLVQQPRTALRVQESMTCFTEASALDPQNLASRFLLASAQSMLFLHDAAISSIEEAIALAPDEGRLPEILATFLCQRGGERARADHHLAAAEDYRRALRHAEDYSIHVLLARSLAKLQDWVGTRASMERALALKPDAEPAVRELLSDALVRLGRFEEALVSLDAVQATGHDCVNASCLRAAALAGLGRLEEALAALDHAITLPQAEHLGVASSLRGRVLVALGRAAEGVEALREAVRLAPERSDLGMALARALQRAGDLPGARAAREQAARVQAGLLPKMGRRSPAFETALYLWGAILGTFLEPEEARARLRDTVADATGTERAAFLVGVAASLFNERLRIPEGEALVNEALEADPRCAKAWEFRGWAHAYRGEHDAAVAAMRTYGECLGSEQAAHSQLYSVLLMAGRFEAAAACLDDCPNCREAATRLRALTAMEVRLPTYLDGSWSPSREEAGDLAVVLALTGRLPPLARLCRDQIAQGPPEGWTGSQEVAWRLATLEAGALGAAALAADGSLPAEERSSWRRQGAAWLAGLADLAREGRRYVLLYSPDVRSSSLVARLLMPEWAPLRDEAALSDAPPEDREACRRAWEALRRYHDELP